MTQVGKVDYFDGAKRKLYFFVEEEDGVEEEGFYKVDTPTKVFYIFVTSLSEQPLDSELGSRYSKEGFSYDLDERFLLYAQASILLEYRKAEDHKIVGYKTIPRHGAGIFELEDSDFDILKLPKLDFANVRSGSKELATKVGFKKESYITHWLLSGWTNSGKTNSAKVLLGVTLKGEEGDSFAGGVVIDPHGEYYKDLKTMNSDGDVRLVHMTINPETGDSNERALGIPLSMLTPNDLYEVADFNPETQGAFMWRCRDYFWRLEKRNTPDTLNILSASKNWIDMIINSDHKLLPQLGDDYKDSTGPKVMDATKRRLMRIIKDDQSVWLPEYTPIVEDILAGVSRGVWYVIDVSSISNSTTKLITSLIAYKLFKKYKDTAINNRAEWKTYKPAGILVEEAHNYLSSDESSKGNIIAKIAKEGRKFNVFSIIVEQDPSGIDERVLKQIHNKITLQLIPVDASAIVKTTPYIAELENKIPYYQTGEGVFVSTGSFTFALPVKFPHISTWLNNNSQKCKECDEGRSFGAKGICGKCSGKKLKKDAKAFM
ncbi:MAG: ATP-binding protein [archaeon]